MSIINRFVKGVDGFITLGHKTAVFIVRYFDELNGVPSHNDSEKSLYDVYGDQKYSDEENPGFNLLPNNKGLELDPLFNDGRVTTESLFYHKNSIHDIPMKTPTEINSVVDIQSLDTKMSEPPSVKKSSNLSYSIDEISEDLSELYGSAVVLVSTLSEQPRNLETTCEIQSSSVIHKESVLDKVNYIHDNLIELIHLLEELEVNLKIQTLQFQKVKSEFKDYDSLLEEVLNDSFYQEVLHKVEQPLKNVQFPYLQESNVFIGFRSRMKLFFCLFHSQKCGLLWVAREILSQELLAGQLTGFYQSLRGLFKQILSMDLLSGQLCCLKKVRGLFHQILSSDLLSGQLCYLKKVRCLFYTDSLFC